MHRIVVGVMTGTSIDGIDAALVRVEGVGLDMVATLVRHVSRGLGALAPPLRAAAAQEPATAGSFARTATAFGTLHADVIRDLLAADDARPDLIVAHGQTVFHEPPDSWQLLDPSPIAVRFDAPIVTDLRGADLAAGGRGAPITPLADWILFRNARERRAVVNLGGFCNVTSLPPADAADAVALIAGGDVCACNHVTDAVARLALGTPYDVNGRAATAGTPLPGAVASLRALLAEQRFARRALGTGDEAETWVRGHLDTLALLDLAATVVAAVAAEIAGALDDIGVERGIVAGGGARNDALVAALATATRATVGLSDTLGIPAEAREAVAMAILGALCADGIPITLPQVTGCRAPAPVAGVWAGREGQRCPTPPERRA